MTVVALCSAKGSPGVTTLACLLGAVWPIGSAVVVAECDPGGGDIGRRFGLPETAGMASFALVAGRGGSPDVGPHLQRLPGGLEVLAGPRSSDAARAVDAEVAGLAALLGAGRDVVVDCGRVDSSAAGQGVLLARADVVMVVVHDDSASIGHASELATSLVAQRGDGPVGVVLRVRGPQAWPALSRDLPAEIASVVPTHRTTAAIVRGEPGSARRFSRSPLVKAAEGLWRWTDAKSHNHSAAPSTSGGPSPTWPTRGAGPSASNRPWPARHAGHGHAPPAQAAGPGWPVSSGHPPAGMRPGRGRGAP